MEKEKQSINFNSVIFRAYDIRGVFGEELTCEVVHEIAKAIGTIAHKQNQQEIVVGRDGRLSSPELNQVLIEGLLSTGIDIIDIGIVPTPATYFASYHLQANNCVMITGSHNAAEYNGLKTVIANNSLSGIGIQEIRQYLISKEYEVGQGTLQQKDISTDYIQRILSGVNIAGKTSLKIVVDCGNGSAGEIAPKLFDALNCNAVMMFPEIDGSFPNHHPDPSQPENLKDLMDKVKEEKADIGFAFDGDGDRLGVIDADGNIIWPDRQLMLLAKDVLSRNKGSHIIFDVKCTRHLKSIIESNNGRALMWKTGHSFIKHKMNEVNAPLAGEMSGHIFFKERWYGFDDALYTAARFIEIFSNSKKTPTELFAELPCGVSTPELRMSLVENEHTNFMKEFSDNIKCELIESMIEINTNICSNIEEVEKDIKKTLNHLDEILKNYETEINCTSLHPFAIGKNQIITDNARYKRIMKELQMVGKRFISQGLHVHIGINNSEDAIKVNNALRIYLPLLLSLSTSSPFWRGENTGFKSYRSIVFEDLPRTGTPEYFDSASSYDKYVETLIESGGVTGLRPDERDILEGVFALHETQVREVMVPRSGMVTLPIDVRFSELMKAVHRTQHARFLVIGESLDDVRGVIDLRQLAEPISRGEMNADSPLEPYSYLIGIGYPYRHHFRE